MCYWILTSNGTVISRTTVQHLTEDEVQNQDIMQDIRTFHTSLKTYLGNDQYIYDDHEFSNFLNEDIPDPIEDKYPTSFTPHGKEEPYQGYQLPEIDEIGNLEDEKEAANTYDKYLGVEIALPGEANNK